MPPLEYDSVLALARTSNEPFEFGGYCSVPIRWPEEQPVAFASMLCALEHFNDQSSAKTMCRARIFRTLMHFLSSLILPDPMPFGDDIQPFWDMRVEELRNDAHPTYFSKYILKMAISIIQQLDPVATYMNINRFVLRDLHLNGDPKETMNYDTTEGEYRMVSRGYDWILRCAFEFEIPLEWRAWTSLMYNPQPYRSGPRHDKSWLQVARAPDDTVDMSYWIAEKGEKWDWVVPLMKWWIRNAFNVLGTWHASLKYGGHVGRLMPQYSWVAIAYEKMWNRFKDMLQDPFSEYPYGLRENVLSNFDFKTVFELSWTEVMVAFRSTSTEDVKVEDLRSFESREKICRSVCENAQVVFRWYDINPPSDIFGEFEAEWPKLCQEGPEVDFDALAHDLPFRTTLVVGGLCSRWYNLPYAAGDWSILDNDSEMEDVWEDHREFELTEDIEMECYGPLIDINEFTVGKKPETEDFCTWYQNGWSQENIGTFDSGGQRCVVPQTCQHTFHAECLADWVNGPSPSSNLCPNCKEQMTRQMRSRRPVIKDDAE